MTAWSLTLFGGFGLSSWDGSEVTSLGRRDRALLAYLALCPGQREARDILATLLWSQRQDEQARHSLAQSTSVIRKALDDADKSFVLSDAESLALDGAAFAVDVLAFQELVSDGSREALKRAAELYTGDFLSGIETRSEGFDQWVDDERNRLRGLATDNLARLMYLDADAGDWEPAIEAASRVLDLNLLREDAHRVLMISYAQTGRRTLALQQYKSLAEVLARELQVDPDQETTELMESIRRGSDPGSSDAARWSPRVSADREDAGDEVQTAQGDAVAESPIASLHPGGRMRARLLWAAGGVVITLVTAVVVIAATFWRIPELAPAPIGAFVRDIKATIAPHPLSIAVLPFESHGDPDAQEFADALSEGMTTALSMSSEMVVVSRSTMRGYGESPAAAQDVAKELNVRYILEGGVRKWDDQIGIEIGLIDALEGQHRIWGESYRRQAGDFISLQQDITFEVITSLKIRLTEGEQERINRAHGTRNLAAWLAAAQGEKHLRRLSERDMAIARAYYERASVIAPDYPGAWDGLGWTHLIGARFGWTTSREDSIRKSKEMADRALALDPERPGAYSLLGSISLVTGDFSQAVRLGEKAVLLGPFDADAAALLAYTLTYTGEPERALALIDRAIRLRPHPPRWYHWMSGRANRLSGRHERAVSILLAESQAAAHSYIPLVELAATYSEMNRLFLAKRTSAEILRQFPDFNIRSWIAMTPYSDPAMKEREVAALRSAGIPE